MSKVIRISHELYQNAQQVAFIESRSVSKQIERWAKIGKCALDNPDLPIQFIDDLLMTKNQDSSLAESFNL